ncbi:hypothetical protein D3C73_1253260 [compost metagenome]
MLAVSHDRYFINRCFGKLWSIAGGRFTAFPGNYEYYKEKQAEKAAASGLSSNSSNGQLQSDNAPKSGSNSSAGKAEISEARLRDSDEARSGSSALVPGKSRPPGYWEEKIAAAEEQLGSIDAEMLDPLISSDADRLAELQTLRDTAQEKLDELYACWMSETDQ